MAKIVVERTVGATQRAILKGLAAFNAEAVGRKPWKTLAISVREGAEVKGGGIGEVWNGWLFVKYLWIDEAFRGADLGRKVVTSLENAARALGADRAYVDTFSFQAPGFYARLGYREFGRLDDYPKGHSRQWLTKDL